MKPGAELASVAGSFKVTTCEGKTELFAKLDTWELLNLKPKTILDLPDRLVKEHGISPKYIETVRVISFLGGNGSLTTVLGTRKSLHPVFGQRCY